MAGETVTPIPAGINPGEHKKPDWHDRSYFNMKLAEQASEYLSGNDLMVDDEIAPDLQRQADDRRVTFHLEHGVVINDVVSVENYSSSCDVTVSGYKDGLISHSFAHDRIVAVWFTDVDWDTPAS